jgi:hypothetical protein
MEWILVIHVIAFFSGDFRVPDSRTRGLTEAACLTLVQEVQGPKTIAYCYRDGEKDPGRARPAKPQPPFCADCRAPAGLGWG